MTSELFQAFESVLRCPNVRKCIEDSAPHPCRKIVESQLMLTGAESYDEFQMPEPWCGQIDIAPILFVSSNPSIGDERALGRCSTDDAFDSHHFALGGGRGIYTHNGVYSLDAAGNRSKRPVYYWSRARDRAQELIVGRPVVWGVDYAMTEVVRCKSRKEFGVSEALEECTSRHFDQTMSIAAAQVIIAVGKGRDLMRQRYGIARSERLVEVSIAGKLRLLAFLPHPSGFEPGPRNLAGLYTSEELERLRNAVVND